MARAVLLSLRHALRTQGLTALLIALAIAAVAVHDAHKVWMGTPRPMIILLLWASAIGLGLAGSRFRTISASAHTLVSSLGLGMLVLGRVVPDPAFLFAHAPSETMWLMNAQVTTYLHELSHGISVLEEGAFPPPVLLVSAYSFAAWHVIHWLIWSAVRRREVWSGLILCFGLLLASDLLAAHPPVWSMALTLGGLLLAARTVYASSVRSWELRGVGYPELMWENWAASVVAIAAVVFLMSGLSTPAWRDSIRRFIDRLRPPPEPTAVAVSGPAELPGVDTTLSHMPDLSVVGTLFPLDGQTLFYVTTSDSPSGMELNGMLLPPDQRHYWRGAIYARYTGRGWEIVPLDPPVRSVQGLPPPDSGRYVLRQTFEVLAEGGESRFAANQPVSVSGDVELVPVAGEEASILVRGSASAYSVVSWAPRLTRLQLGQAGTDYPDAIRAAYLQVPEEIPQRVRNLAARLALGARSAYEKAARVQAYLRSRVPYRQDAPMPPADRDVIDYFLFDAPGGFCSYYASAMAVLLRLEGVPARVVTGYATGEWDGRLGRYRVPLSAAHAWVEVYFPDYGWIPFEPTPSLPSFDYPPEGSADEEASRTGERAGVLRPRTPVVPAVVGIGLVGSAAALIVIRRHRKRALDPGSELRRQYWHMRRVIGGRDDSAGSPHLTPDEYLAEHEAHLKSMPCLACAARVMTSTYIQSAYSPCSPTGHEVKDARHAWQSAWRERLRLAWRPRSHAGKRG